VQGPAVSVCIPAYQAERHLESTLRSAVAQDEPDMEVLVLDNASTDRTAEILATFDDPRIRVERNTSVLSLPDNWNRLVSLSRGEFVKVLCADDLIRRDAVSRQARALREHREVALVASRRHLVDDGGVLLATGVGLRGMIGPHSSRKIARAVVRNGGNPIGEAGNVMFRRADFDAVGGFDGSLVFPMDLDLWVRLLTRGSFVGQRDSLAAFRIASSSLSARAAERQYAEQRQLTERIAADPRWRVSRLDLAVGALRAPLAKVRRRAVFRFAGWAQWGN
jgi:glycosyltransferase involved in cell wall biosynthesis